MRGLIVVVTLVGCYQPSPSTNVPCASNGECPADQTCDVSQSPPTCITGDAAVAVIPDAALAMDGPILACGGGCPPELPICDPSSQTCRGCANDADCPDDVCVESTGQCVAAADALYVAPNGDDNNGTCTQAAPCATISGALANLSASRRTIRVAQGTYADAFLVSNIMPITISGDGTAPKNTTINFAPMGFGGTALDHSIEDVGSTVTIEGLTFANAANEIARVSNNGNLHLFATTLSAGGGGVDCSNANVILTGVIATGSSGIGVHAAGGNGCSMTIHRSVIADNAGVGLSLTNSGFDVSNTWIVLNTGGGVTVATARNMAKLSFDTIAKNSTSAIGPAALVCDVGFPVDDTLFADNGAAPQISDTCTTTYSLFSDTAPQGTGNTSGPSFFVSPNQGNFHIGPQSAARDAADPVATLDVDIDGEVRPQGQARDIGADEIP